MLEALALRPKAYVLCKPLKNSWVQVRACGLDLHDLQGTVPSVSLHNAYYLLGTLAITKI